MSDRYSKERRISPAFCLYAGRRVGRWDKRENEWNKGHHSAELKVPYPLDLLRRFDFTDTLQIGNTLLTERGDNEGEHKRSNSKEIQAQ